MGEDAMLGGLAVGVRRPFLSDLVQPSVRSELSTSPSTPHHHPTGGDHRGGRHRDPTQLDPLSEDDALLVLKR